MPVARTPLDQDLESAAGVLGAPIIRSRWPRRRASRQYADVWLEILCALLGGFFAVVAAMPVWLKRVLRGDLDRTQLKIRQIGERNPYVSLATDPDRFLGQLRLAAVAAALVSVGVLVVLVLG